MLNNEQSMTPAKRQQLIMKQINHDKFVDVKELSAKYYINEATIRRDLNTLEHTGLIKRTYGGAVLIEGLDAEIPLYARESSNIEKKDFIGKKASYMVHDGDTIILDSSSTTSRIIKYLSNKSNLKIITNGAKTAVLLTKLNNCTIYCTGGKMRENSLSFIGQTAIEYIKNFYADIAFFSCRSLSFERGLTDSNDDEAILRREMIESSKKSVLLIDSTKLNTTSFFSICPITSINQIICDIPISANILSELKKN